MRCSCAIRCRPFARHGSGRWLVFASVPLPPSPPHQGATWGSFGAVGKVRSRLRSSNSHPIRLIPCASHARVGVCGLFVATGTSMRVAECATGRGPTTRVPGVATGAAAALAALAAARRQPLGRHQKPRPRPCRGRGCGLRCCACPAAVGGPGAPPAGSGPARRSPTAMSAPAGALDMRLCGMRVASAAVTITTKKLPL